MKVVVEIANKRQEKMILNCCRTIGYEIVSENPEIIIYDQVNEILLEQKLKQQQNLRIILLQFSSKTFVPSRQFQHLYDDRFTIWNLRGRAKTYALYDLLRSQYMKSRRPDC